MRNRRIESIAIPHRDLEATRRTLRREGCVIRVSAPVTVLDSLSGRRVPGYMISFERI